jgi:hypothetical protein
LDEFGRSKGVILVNFHARGADYRDLTLVIQVCFVFTYFTGNLMYIPRKVICIYKVRILAGREVLT